MNKKMYSIIYTKYHGTTFAKICRRLNQIITGCTFILYPVLLLTLFLRKNPLLISCIMIPGISFIVVSLFRKIVNRKRPYESWQIPPLIPRDKTGHSFPSRHVFSIFLIATLWLSENLFIAVILLICSFVLATLRVFAGVHYLSDVLAGALLGMMCGYLSLLVCFI